MTSPAPPDLQTLVSLFYDDPRRLASFDEVKADALPPAYQQLLDHHDHMTVTVEAFHSSAVDVEVLERRVAEGHYSRKIILRRQSDGRVVQFGIVRLNLEQLQPDVRREIESERTPLGRVLIEHDVMREVQLVALWRVGASRELARWLELPQPSVTYGRTALIYCHGEPAVELLEIVAPVE
ncbi:MAG: hypothetical protein J5I93_28015 [Pirellulaceae bacterium]|nr:hypothetical protein [Pirellulaceae bacterium]